MAEESVNQGARASIGWTDTTTVGSSRTFTDHLLKRLNDGYSISSSASYASSKIIWPWDNVKDYELFWVTSGTIKADVNNKQNTTSYEPLYSYPDPPWLYMESGMTLTEIDAVKNLNDNELTSNKSSLEYLVENEKVYRSYTYVNGILTSNFMDSTESGRVIERNINELDIDKINFDLFNSFREKDYIDFDIYKGYNVSVNGSFNAIINYEGSIIPIRIVYLDLTDEIYGDVYSIAKVFNIASGEEINYSDISYLDKGVFL